MPLQVCVRNGKMKLPGYLKSHFNCTVAPRSSSFPAFIWSGAPGPWCIERPAQDRVQQYHCRKDCFCKMWFALRVSEKTNVTTESSVCGGALAAFGALFLSGWNSRISACQPGLPVGCWLCRHDPNQLLRNQNVACMQQTSMTQQARLVFLFAHLEILSQQANSPPSVAKPLKQSVLKPQTAQQRVHPDNLWILCCIEHEIRKPHNLSRAISMAPRSGPLNCLLYMCFV